MSKKTAPAPLNSIRLIEFVFCSPFSNQEEETPVVGAFHAEEVTHIMQFNSKFCTIEFKNGKEYRVYGTYRTLMNRLIYCLQLSPAREDFYYDEIVRPSISIQHRPDELEKNNVYFDSPQLIAFFQALRPELLEKDYIMEKIS